MAKKEVSTEQRVEQLKALLPEAFSEGTLNFERLASTLGMDFSAPSHESYGLQWVGKQEAQNTAKTPSTTVLHTTDGVEETPPSDKDILIEGDNLEALKILSDTHAGKVDVIYIDPPYNTGQDFVYLDNFRESPSSYLKQLDHRHHKQEQARQLEGRYHSRWLSMMYPRLSLARDLLSEKGVLFCSIDDHECHNLRHLLDEIFGSQHFVGMLIWERKRKGSHLSKQLTKKTEYIFVYAKQSKGLKLYGEPASAQETQPLVKKISNEGTLRFPKESVRTRLKDQSLAPGVYGKGNSQVELLEETSIKDGGFTEDIVLRGRFIWTQERVDLEVSRGGHFTMHTKRLQPRVLKSEASRGFKALSTLLLKEVGTNEDATEEVAERLGLPVDSHLIGYPKPLGLIETLLRAATYWKKDAVVLDFFAGTGTTGEAIWSLNQEDGGTRRFILVQWPEETGDEIYPTISSLTAARLRIVAQRYDKGDEDVERYILCPRE